MGPRTHCLGLLLGLLALPLAGDAGLLTACDPADLPDSLYEAYARPAVLEVATGELHVREATGANDGPRVTLYLRSVGLDAGYPWCAAFVHWTYRQVGIVTSANAWSPSWFPSGRLVYHRTRKARDGLPAPGDVFGIYFPSRGRIAHVGIVESWNEGGAYVLTIEGNTNDFGSREGDGVYRKKRPRRQIYAVANWITPKA